MLKLSFWYKSTKKSAIIVYSVQLWRGEGVNHAMLRIINLSEYISPGGRVSGLHYCITGTIYNCHNLRLG